MPQNTHARNAPAPGAGAGMFRPRDMRTDTVPGTVQPADRTGTTTDASRDTGRPDPRLDAEIVIAMPALNEGPRAEAAIRSLLADPAADRCAFVLVDGGSTDGTAEVTRAAFGDRVVILANPGRLQAHAVNLVAREAARTASARYLLRADLHAVYPAHFISTLVETAERTGATSVVVPMRTRGGSPVQDAAALAFGSWFGTGGAPHRMASGSGWVAHGHHALLDLDAFLRAGGYDTGFVANEDAEFDVRLQKQGGRIYMEAAAAIDYIPRASLTGTFRQYCRNGRYRIWTAAKHRRMLGARQLLPLAILPVLGTAVLAGLWLPWLWLVPLGYGALLLGLAFAARGAAVKPWTPRMIVLAAAIAGMSQIGFSAGNLCGLADLFVLNPARRRALRGRRRPDPRI
ncbi:glycosyltransferase family 2 protein [Roseisalinus antarcticus]|uniref:Glycosyl transferase family 2 n=1 Tax=Roseisalinus antarcticus TaxID=254357 RepID=A0A1Y5TPX9_9RHOB|nr:glycosyltransferase family 2 protein [Roseisalinus antarcticus]SLN69205.1 Glycosyl transferase family 2 [Roseisalinus antarcticus]